MTLPPRPKMTQIARCPAVLRVHGDATAHGGAGFDTIWAGEESTAYGGTGQDNMVVWGDATGYGGWGMTPLRPAAHPKCLAALQTMC